MKKPNLENLALMVSDHVTAMLAYWDYELTCRYANKAYLEWFGRKREDMIGKMKIAELLGPLYEMNLPFIEGALRGEQQTFYRDIPKPEGGIRPSLATYIPHVVDGRVCGFFVHVADVTKIKQLENELKRFNKVISEQNTRLLNFANVVSHNLRSYSNNLQTLLNLYQCAESEMEKQELFKHLQNIAASFTSTVQNLNEIVHVQNLISIQSEPVNLHFFVEKVRNILKIYIDETQAELINAIDESYNVVSNPAYIESIFLNLISNAIKYRHASRKPIISVHVDQNESDVVIQFSDNGRGIDLSRFGDQIFGMYKTFHGNNDAKGIGLFITKFQVEALGGRIEVESDVDKGSRFSVILPAKDNVKHLE